MMRGDAEKSVVMEKADEGGRGKIERTTGSDTPNGGTHGHEIEAQEIVTEAKQEAAAAMAQTLEAREDALRWQRAMTPNSTISGL
jgi:hypothetical protein